MTIKRLFLLLCLAFAGATTQAQDFTFGVRGGMNIGNLQVDPASDFVSPDSRYGVQIGVFGQTPLTDRILFQPELSYAQEGAKIEDVEEIEKVKLGYMVVGTGVKYKLTNAIHVLMVPQLGFLSGGEFEEEDKIENTTEAIAAKEVMKSTNLSLAFGGSYTLNSGIEIGARYNLGLTDSNDDPLEEGFFDVGQSVKTRSLMFSVGYVFDL